MSLAALIRSMAEAGAPAEAIAIAVEALEAADAREAARREAARDKKRAQRAAKDEDKAGTVPGQSRDAAGTVPTDPPSPALSPQTPQTHPHPPGDTSTREARAREEAGFARFWTAYPRKTAKADARKAFAKAWRKLPIGEEAETLSGGLERAMAAWTDAQFIPHAATWLNGERWQDEPSTVIPMERRTSVQPPDRRLADRHENYARAFAGASAVARRQGGP